MKLGELLHVLDGLAPLRHAEAWDNVGLVVGDPSADVARVLVTVDYTRAVADEARELGAALVVAYHPPLFSAVKRAPHDALWVEAVRLGISLYTMHTALDVARSGTNDVLADDCGVVAAGRRAIRPIELPKRELGDPGELGEIGQGRIGVVEAASRREVVDRLKVALGLERVLVAGPLDAPVRRVAVAAGAGGELLEPAIRAGAEVFVTGELRHHDALLAAHRGVTVVATLHSNSERRGVAAFSERLAGALVGVDVKLSTRDRDPFSVV